MRLCFSLQYIRIYHDIAKKFKTVPVSLQQIALKTTYYTFLLISQLLQKKSVLYSTLTNRNNNDKPLKRRKLLHMLFKNQ